LLFLIGIVAALSHILLDFTNNYGVRPFMPFNWHWYSWDIVFVVEPLLLLILTLGLILPEIFALVGSDIGARRERSRGRGPAIVAFVAIALLWWIRDYEHRRAITLLTAGDYRGETVKKAAAVPYPVNPFVWHGIVETQSFFAALPVDPRKDDMGQLERAQVWYKPAETPDTLAAKRSPLGLVYLDWARFPVTEREPLQPPDGGYLVRFHDLRFDYDALNFGNQRGGTPALSATVVLDRDLHIVEMRVGKRAQKP
jgi:inner membrane protein